MTTRHALQGAPPSEAAQQKAAVAGLAASLLQAHAAAASCAAESHTAGTATFAGSAAAALPLLLAAYGATMSDADRALLAAIRTIDRLTAAGSGDGVSQLLASTGYTMTSVCSPLEASEQPMHHCRQRRACCAAPTPPHKARCPSLPLLRLRCW